MTDFDSDFIKDRMEDDFLNSSWCEECESPTNHTTEQHREAESERLEYEAERLQEWADERDYL